MGKVFVLKLEDFGLPKLSAFYCPDSFPSGHVFCGYLSVVQELQEVAFPLGEVNVQLDECSPLDVKIFPATW